MTSVQIRDGRITLYAALVIEASEEIDLAALARAIVGHVDEAEIEQELSETGATIHVHYSCRDGAEDGVRDALRTHLATIR